MTDLFDLTGKTALITGGAGLLGEEHSRALLDIGAKIIITDINFDNLKQLKARLPSAHHNNIIIKKMDVTKSLEIRNCLKYFQDINIKIDILINNAAIDPKFKDIDDRQATTRIENYSELHWDMELAVGLKGAFLCSSIFGHRMAISGTGGVILNIASDLSVISPDQRLYLNENESADNQPVKPVTYSVIKSGLIGMTRYLATYWAENGVRCNALSPGGVFNGQDEEFTDKIKHLIPMKRMANKSEYHGAIQFLCSNASSYMNGQNIVIDGGRSVW